MKTLLIFVVLISLCPLHTAQNKDAIYFENYESVKFEADEYAKTLSFNVNNEKGFSAIVFTKIAPDEFNFTIMVDGEVTSEKTYNEDIVRSVMPELMSYYLDKYDVSLDQLNKIVNKIY